MVSVIVIQSDKHKYLCVKRIETWSTTRFRFNFDVHLAWLVNLLDIRRSYTQINLYYKFQTIKKTVNEVTYVRLDKELSEWLRVKSNQLCKRLLIARTCICGGSITQLWVARGHFEQMQVYTLQSGPVLVPGFIRAHDKLTIAATFINTFIKM